MSRAPSVFSRTWYHGSQERLPLDLEELRYDRRVYEQELNAEGPGWYWTTDPDNARMYGRHIYEAEVQPGARILTERDKPTLPQLLTLYGSADDDDREVFLSNWNEEPGSHGAKTRALRAYLTGHTLHEAALLLYHDLFRYDSKSFVLAMRKLGDAMLIDKREKGNERFHLVVYEPLIMREG